MHEAEKRRAAALDRVTQIELLTDIAVFERRKLEHLIDLALMQPMDANRWLAYERLKKMARHFVGWYAGQAQLQTSGHYMAMLDFIDWLLPESPQDTGEHMAIDAAQLEEEGQW